MPRDASPTFPQYRPIHIGIYFSESMTGVQATHGLGTWCLAIHLATRIDRLKAGDLKITLECSYPLDTPDISAPLLRRNSYRVATVMTIDHQDPR